LPYIFHFIKKIAKPLAFQLTDKRSAITKEACLAIQIMATVFKQDCFGEKLAGEEFVTENSLFKLMQVANNIMADHAHICMLTIID
jgi:hypothetical protein